MKFKQTENQIAITNKPYAAYVMAGIALCAGIALVVLGFTVTDAGPLFSVGGGVFILFGIALPLLAQARYSNIALGGNTTITLKWLNHTVRQLTFPTNSIRGLRLVSSLQGSQKADTLLCVLQDNSAQVLADKKGKPELTLLGIPLSLLFRNTPLQAQSQQIADFLGVPLEQNDLNSMAGIVNTVQEVMAEARGTAEPGQVGGLIPPQARAQIQALEEKRANENRPSDQA